MVLEFIEFSAVKNGVQFSRLSNLDLLQSGRVSPSTAKKQLIATADALEASGCQVVWKCRAFTADELEEWIDLIRAGQWAEEQRIYAEFG